MTEAAGRRTECLECPVLSLHVTHTVFWLKCQPRTLPWAGLDSCWPLCRTSGLDRTAFQTLNDLYPNPASG